MLCIVLVDSLEVRLLVLDDVLVELDVLLEVLVDSDDVLDSVEVLVLGTLEVLELVEMVVEVVVGAELLAFTSPPGTTNTNVAGAVPASELLPGAGANSPELLLTLMFIVFAMGCMSWLGVIAGAPFSCPDMYAYEETTTAPAIASAKSNVVPIRGRGVSLCVMVLFLGYIRDSEFVLGVCAFA